MSHFANFNGDTTTYQQWIKPNSPVTSLHNVFTSLVLVRDNRNKQSNVGEWEVKSAKQLKWENKKVFPSMEIYDCWCQCLASNRMFNLQYRYIWYAECKLSEKRRNHIKNGIGNCMLNSKQCLWSNEIWEYDRYHANSIPYFISHIQTQFTLVKHIFEAASNGFFVLNSFVFLKCSKKIKHSGHSS